MSPARTSEDLRAHNRARLLRAVHDHGASLTRAQLTEQLGMARGTASVLVAELAEAKLVTENPTEQLGRGRPSQVPGPHPAGPIALTVALREDGWELAAAEVGGATTSLGDFEHDGVPQAIFTDIATELERCRDRYGSRLIGVGISVAGPVRQGRLVHVSEPTWQLLDVNRWLRPGDLPVHLANDATLAALAEARRGRLRGTDVALHLHVDFGVGGCLVHDGRPITGAHGIAGEFGHMRLTGGDEPCSCGATGCWGQQVGVMPLLRGYGVGGGYRDGRSRARQLLESAATGDARAREVLERNARALGSGIGGLVNAHDPRIVTLSGMGTALLTNAADSLRESYLAALMRYHRTQPPELVAADLGPRGPLLGAAELVYDAFLTPEGIEGFSRVTAAT
ncbi:ROK family protein [Stackebrandtia endophytica]|nr:ROK family transcriptional regulator [Stackebrandtia endophytica]